MTSLILFFIHTYQKMFSPDTGFFKRLYFTGKTCRFNPTCSEYAYQAIERYGILRGAFLGVKRILKCHPGNPGGNDPLQ